MQQFWVEALLTTMAALVLGLVLAELSLPLFNKLAGTMLQFSLDTGLLLMLVAIFVLVGLVAGSYPAIVLSGFRPIEVLKGRLSSRSDSGWLRRCLVVFQFALAIVMIVGTVTMARQLSFMQNLDLGFDQQNIIVLPLAGPAEEGWRLAGLVANEVRALPFTAAVTAAAFPPGDGQFQVGYTDDQNRLRQLNLNIIQADFVSTMGMEIVSGRDFLLDNASDLARGIIINEAFAREYGWENAVGQRLPAAQFPDHEVIGVVKDFHFTSLHNQLTPTMLVLDFAPFEPGFNDTITSSSPTPDMLIRLRTADVQRALTELETIWQRLLPDEPFAYHFLEDALDAQYRDEQRLGQIVQVSALLAVFIACLGLFGLATFMADRRTKEIGVRKVMGGSVWSIVLLLTNDFSRLVLLANLLAWPVAYFAMNRWLENFAYRIDLTPLIFIGSGMIALCIAWVTVGSTAAKAASAKPVLALRYE